MRTTKLFIVFALVAFSTIHANAQRFNKDKVERYVERYRGLAMSEQQRTGIPAAIKLAQGIHETGAGTSKLAVEGNNHFGLKCKTNWKGATIMHTDNRRNECFRKYNLDFESYQDHSNYLASNPRYANLFNTSVTDYAGWAFGLREAGYATNPQYAQLLIKLIEDYRLQEYTYAAMSSSSSMNNNTARRNNNSYQQNRQQPVQTRRSTSSWQTNRGTQPANNGAYTRNIDNTPPRRVSKYIDTEPTDRQTVVRTNRNGRAREQVVDNGPSTIVKINNLKAIYGKRGDMPLQYAVRNGIRYEKFLEMNDLEDKPLPADMPLYLERKHFWGIRPMHLVKPYETLIQIAQQEGIQLKYLRDLNYLEPDEEPVPGVTLELQAQAGEKPKVVKRKPEPVYNPAQQQQDRYVNTQPAKPVSTFPKNPAPPFEEEPNIIEKIKAAREARRREKEGLSAQQPAQTNQVPQYKATPQQQTQTTQQPQQQRVVQQPPPQQQQRQTPPAQQQRTTAQQPVQSYSRQQYSYQNRNITPNPAATVQNNNTQKKLSRKEKRKLKENPYANTAPNQPAQTLPQQPQQPKTELDKLKAQFDDVIYADGNTSRQQPVRQNNTQQYQQQQRQTGYQQNNNQQQRQQPRYQQNTQQQYQAQTYSDNDQYGQQGGYGNDSPYTNQQQNDPSKYYMVKPGDTAYTIAKKHGITIRQLMEMNDLDFDQIKEGANLRVKQ